MDYNPSSTDAMFSRLMARLDGQDKTLEEILREVRRTNGRVTKLETAKEVTAGRIALISFLATGFLGVVAWGINLLVKK